MNSSVAILAQELLKSFWLNNCRAMSANDEFWDPGVPAFAGASGADESWDVAPLDGPLPRRAAGRVGRPRAPPESGTFGVWLVETRDVAAASSSAAAPPSPSFPHEVVGLARLTWRYEPSVTDLAAPAVARGPGTGARDRGVAPPWGRIEYMVDDIWQLSERVALVAAFDFASGMAPMTLLQCCKDVLLLDPAEAVGEFIDSSDVEFHCISRSVDVARLLVEQRPTLLREVALTARVAPDMLYRRHPPQSSIDRWRGEAGAKRRPKAPAASEVVEPRPTAEDTILLALPDELKPQAAPAAAALKPWDRATDPIKVINAIAMSLHLRQEKELSETVDDALIYVADPDNPPPPRDHGGDVGRTAIQTGKGKADVVGLLLHRRQFHYEMSLDLIDAINIYSDASPVVGAEIQGMLVDFVFPDGTYRRVQLPGATLSYGHFDAYNKSMALVWAIWLICGPCEKHLTYFFFENEVADN